MLVFGTRRFTEAHQDKAQALLTKLIVTNMLPLLLVDDEAFREFINTMENQTCNYLLKIVSRKFGMTRQHVHSSAHELAEKNNLEQNLEEKAKTWQFGSF